jgi:hypothetical protein
MRPLDLHQEYPQYFRALPQPELIHLDQGKFISIDGHGCAGGKEMSSRIKALYPVASRIRAHYLKKGQDFIVPQLESEWWANSRKPINKIPREDRKWKLMIRVPDYVEPKVIEQAKKDAIIHDRVMAALWVRLETKSPHDAVQMLHLGPWSREGDTIKVIRQYIKQKNLVLDGHHHEVYLSDPHHTDPARLRTILRQTVVN